MNRKLWAGLPIAVGCLGGCTSDDGTAGAGGGGAAGSGGGAGGVGGASVAKAPFEVASYRDGSGLLILVPISVNGSVPFGVLLDTGSDGLRVFEAALQGTPAASARRPES